MHSFLVDLIVFLSAAVISVPLFKRIGAAPILAYLFAGILIGPYSLSFIKDPDTILRFSELGVVFLLFLIGLELKPSTLWKMRQTVFGLGFLQVAVTGATLMYLAHYFGLSWSTSFIIGYGLALSSTAFGLQILQDKRQLKTLHGQGSFSILLFQDLAVVPMIATIPLLIDAKTMAGGLSIEKIGIAVGVLILFIIFGLFFIHYFFRLIAEARVQEVFTATALLIVVGSAFLMESVGLSMGTGAFFAGMLLANSEYRHELEVNLEPFKGLLLGLFFIAVGMTLDLSVLTRKPDIVLIVVLVFMIVKGIIIFGLARLFKYPYESSRNMAFTLSQGGEFAFVIFSLAYAAGLLSSEIQSILNTSVTISMALTPLVFNLNQKFLRSYREISERPLDNIQNDGSEVVIAGYGRFGQVVARMLEAEHIKYTILEHSASQVDAARRFGVKIYYGDASRKDTLEQAGAADAKIFVLAIDDPEKSLETAKLVCKHFPNLNIIARARNRQHALNLMELGITNIHRETLLTSLEVSKEVLKTYGYKVEKINKRLALFRKNDESILKKQFELRNSESEMISFTRQANDELQKILREETGLKD